MDVEVQHLDCNIKAYEKLAGKPLDDCLDTYVCSGAAFQAGVVQQVGVLPRGAGRIGASV